MTICHSFVFASIQSICLSTIVIHCSALSVVILQRISLQEHSGDFFYFRFSFLYSSKRVRKEKRQSSGDVFLFERLTSSSPSYICPYSVTGEFHG